MALSSHAELRKKSALDNITKRAFKTMKRARHVMKEPSIFWKEPFTMITPFNTMKRALYTMERALHQTKEPSTF